MNNVIFDRDTDQPSIKVKQIKKKETPNNMIVRHPSTIKELTEKAESNEGTYRDNIEKRELTNRDKQAELLMQPQNVINHTIFKQPKPQLIDTHIKQIVPPLLMTQKPVTDMRSESENADDEKEPPESEQADQQEQEQDQEGKNDVDQEHEEDEEEEENEEEHEEEENEQDEAEDDSNKNTRINIKEEFYLREPEYKSRIDQLEKALHIERGKSALKQKSTAYDNIINDLKIQIGNKEKEIVKYSSINSHQRNQLEELSLKLDHQLKSINYHQITKKKQSPRIHDYKAEYEHSIQIIEKQLKNSLALVEILTKDNTALKIKYNNLNKNQNKQLINKSKDYEQQMINLQLEIKKLKRTLDDHYKCEEIRQEYTHNMRILSDDIKHLQKKNEGILNVIKTKEMQTMKIIDYTEKNKPLITASTQKKNTPKLVIKSRLQTEMNELDSERNTKCEQMNKLKEILSMIEIQAIQCVISKNDYDRVIQQIITLETFRLSMESKHKMDVKKYLQKMNELDEQIDFMHYKSNENDTKAKLYLTQLTDYKHDKLTYSKKISEIQEKIFSMNYVIKEKDTLLKTLTCQLNSLRKIIKKGHNNKADKDFTKHIETLQNEVR